MNTSAVPWNFTLMHENCCVFRPILATCIFLKGDTSSEPPVQSLQKLSVSGRVVRPLGIGNLVDKQPTPGQKIFVVVCSIVQALFGLADMTLLFLTLFLVYILFVLFHLLSCSATASVRRFRLHTRGASGAACNFHHQWQRICALYATGP